MFRINQKVVCIDGRFPGWAHELYDQLPRQDGIYTVRSVSVGRGNPVNQAHIANLPVQPGSADGEILIRLHELRNGPDPVHVRHDELGFKAERFRALNYKKEPATKKKTNEDEEDYTYSDSGEHSRRDAAFAPAEASDRV